MRIVTPPFSPLQRLLRGCVWPAVSQCIIGGDFMWPLGIGVTGSCHRDAVRIGQLKSGQNPDLTPGFKVLHSLSVLLGSHC
jgi:hypothetical protein